MQQHMQYSSSGVLQEHGFQDTACWQKNGLQRPAV
jgi:hypothetical protein